jgi:hypothetical protein
MSKVFSKFKRTAITDLVNSIDQETVISVAIANGGTNYAVNDILQIAGGTVIKVTGVNSSATNAILSVSVVNTGTYFNFTDLYNVPAYNVPDNIASGTYGGQETVSGSGFKVDVELDVNTIKTNRFYMLAAGTTERETVPVEKETEYDGFINIWDETVFGKSAGLIPVARRISWEPSTFYSAYDDKDELLSTKDFFVIDTSSKEVYKCIDNGATVDNTEPLSANNPGEYLSVISGTPFTLSDGYTWLYMGTVNTQIDEIYGTPLYFPVQEYANTKLAAVNGGLFNIRVSNIGDEYLTVSGRTIEPIGSSTNRVRLAGTIPNPSFYSNSGIVIANTSGGVEVKRIGEMVTLTNAQQEQFTEVELAEFENFTAGFLQNNQQYIISPYVEIKSKTGSGAVAYSIVADDGSIERIEMVNYGSGYKDATAILGTAPGIGSGATLRPIISPGAGHGSNIFDELFVDSLCISSKFDESNFPLEPKYNTVALLKNPTYSKDIPPLPEKTFNANTALIKDNTFNASTGVNGTTEFITTTSAHGLVNRTQVKYLVSSGNTAIGGLVADSSYFVIDANTTAFKLSTTPTGTAINLTPGVSETGHTLRRVGQGYITITSNNLRTGDKVVYDVKTGNTAISPLVSGKTYYVASSNSTTISLSETSGGPAIALVPGISETGHGLTRSATTEDSAFFGTSFIQTINIPLIDNGLTDLILGELVVGDNQDPNTLLNPSGRVAFSNSTLLQLTGVNGMFVHSSSLTGETSGETVYTLQQNGWDEYFGTTNTAVGSEDYNVKMYSGDILYAKNVQEITRNDSSDEQIKIVIKL